MTLRQLQRGAGAAVLAVICVLANAAPASALELHSSAYPHGGEMPAHLTCTQPAGEIGRSPPLAWSGVPRGTKSFVLLMIDPDAPDPAAPTKPVVHWSMYNIPATVTSLTEGMNGAPKGGRDGMNERNETGYLPPCPSVGQHRYVITLSAMDSELPNLGTATKESLEEAMKRHTLASAVLVGTYQKESGAKKAAAK